MSRTKNVDWHNEVVKKILFVMIKKGKVRVKDVVKDAIKDSAPVSKSYTVFYWLRDNGHIQKTCIDHLAPYVVTEKGKKYFEGI